MIDNETHHLLVEALKAAYVEIDNSSWTEGVFFGPDDEVMEKLSNAIFKLTGARPEERRFK